MTFGSVCSGIEAASVAWEPLGWRCAFVSEIDPFASAVLKHRYPAVPNLGDFTKIGLPDGPTPGAIDLLVGGTPCQDFSVAGERAGMDGADGQLALEYVALLDRVRPRWMVWENVPGCLSTNEGRDFGAFLGALGECGYGFAYRVLDAQFTGVPQRRRRVFVVGYLGDWRPPSAVLLERQSLQGHPAPRREAGQGVAGTLGGGTGSRGWASDTDRMTFVPVAHALIGSMQRLDRPVETLLPITFTNRGIGAVGASAETLRAGAHGALPMVAVPAYVVRNNQTGSKGTNVWEDKTGTLNCAGPDAVLAPHQVQVRRLTPLECERLQGCPDNWTAITYRGKPAADGPRYRAIGNSMAVPVIRWLGERIQMVETLQALWPVEDVA
ncbi:MAG TPA: DNA (cytosine-5-)-methyltransferase [Chloroflexota bacterium]|nr:DNA (cytosine-5-)-methyltransferase [Chloroflexota bacterium]